MTILTRGRTWALAAALIASLAACGGPVQDCKSDARKITIAALETGVPTSAVPTSCQRLSPAEQHRIGVELTHELWSMMFDQDGNPTPAYAALQVPRRSI